MPLYGWNSAITRRALIAAACICGLAVGIQAGNTAYDATASYVQQQLQDFVRPLNVLKPRAIEVLVPQQVNATRKAARLDYQVDWSGRPEHCSEIQYRCMAS
jgi:hypothetical protein